MNVLVCGGAGYIGSNMTAILAQRGHKPVVFDNLSRGHKSAIKKAEFVRGELSDFNLLIETFKQYKIEAVMHFAGLIEVGESVQKPLEYFQNNVSATNILLSAMNKAGIEKFVFSSSAAVYGNPARIPIKEDSPKEPINPYGLTKLVVEQICHSQSQTGNLRYAALRYFNAAGAGIAEMLGEDHRPETHLIPLVIQAAMGKRPDIKIYGTDYATPDGTCIRDYIHIEDLCEAHLLALKKLDEKVELIFNLGNGKGYSVRQIVDTVKEISGKNFKVVETERRPGDPPILIADAEKAKKELGWQTKYPQIEKIIESAWKWHNKYPNGYPD